MSDAAYNIFGAVAGALGLIGLLPLVCLVVKCQLPIAKAKALEDILSDTKDFLLFVVEEGHMTDDKFAYDVGVELDQYVLLRSRIKHGTDHASRYQERADELKIEAYRDDGYVSQLKGMLTGLSCRIYAIYRKVRKIRSKISVGSGIAPLCVRVRWLMCAILQRKAYEDKKKRTSLIRSILPALRRASTGVVDADDEKLDDVPDSSTEATEGASQDESDISRDTRDPPAYCTILDKISGNVQYTEELRTNDEDAGTSPQQSNRTILTYQSSRS